MNDLQAISTDHCGYTREQKALGKDDFRQIPNGAVGMENRLHMIHHFGVREGRITLNRMVELLSTSPAKLFGMYPRKGTVAVGSDADIVVFDPEKRARDLGEDPSLRDRHQHLRRHEVVGSPELVLRRGEVIVDGERAAREGGQRAVREAGALPRRAQAGGSADGVAAASEATTEKHARGRPR